MGFGFRFGWGAGAGLKGGWGRGAQEHIVGTIDWPGSGEFELGDDMIDDGIALIGTTEVASTMREAGLIPPALIISVDSHETVKFRSEQIQ